MQALPIMVATLVTLGLGYRFYSRFLATRVLGLDDSRPTPAHTRYDGQNYYPTGRLVLFGHHFAAITGAGPLLGPVLATQFGFLPGLLWIVIGVVLAGAVQDFVILTASVRRGGLSLAQIAEKEISPLAGITAAIATLFIVVVALAGLAFGVVNALHHSPWGTFTIGCSIPIGFMMGLWMYVWRKGDVRGASIVGVLLLLGAVVAGHPVAQSPALRPYFTFGQGGIVTAIAIYGFVASVLPVWMLLCPRDYLSSYMKIGTIGFLVLGIFVVNPTLKFPATTAFIHGGGPIIPGSVFPFVFITIACGAISGFHSLVASGTTPKMIDKESDCRPVAYGAMLMEGLVGVTALIAAACLDQGDYFAINTTPEQFSTLGMNAPNLESMRVAVGEDHLAGRTGGAVSLAVGMAQVFSGFPGMANLVSYWYHFAIMFEALFILTTIDTGTRVARFLVQELLGKVWAPMARTEWLPANLTATTLVVVAWTWFLTTGSIKTIWPMFGVANQLLACVALSVGTTVILNEGKGRLALVTFLPLCFITLTTVTAGILSIRDNYLPVARSAGPQAFPAMLNTFIIGVMMILVFVFLIEAVRSWKRTLAGVAAPSSEAK